MDIKMDNNMEVKYAFRWVINWIWYVKYHVTETGLIHIHEYRRFHGSNMNHPCFNNDEIMEAYNVYKNGSDYETFRLYEDGERTIKSIDITEGYNNENYNVENPKHIFGY